MRSLVVVATVGAFVVVSAFVAALVDAPRDNSAFVWVEGDDTAAVGAPWRLFIGAANSRGAASFVGSVNGVASHDGVVDLARAEVVDVVGFVDGAPLHLQFSAPIAALRDDLVVKPATTARVPGTLPLGDGLPRVRLRSHAPDAGSVVEVDADDAGSDVEFFVGGRLVARQRGFKTALVVPHDAATGSSVVVSVADSPVPSARRRVLLDVVGGAGARDLTDDELAARAPARESLPNLAPSRDEQQRQQRAFAEASYEKAVGRFDVVAGVVVFVVFVFAMLQLRRTPVAAIGSVVVVIVLFAGLFAMLRVLA